jgi:hypothetical protein
MNVTDLYCLNGRRRYFEKKGGIALRVCWGRALGSSTGLEPLTECYYCSIIPPLAPEEQARKQSKYHIGSPYSSLILDHQLNLKHDMVDKFLCDKQSPNPAHDAENPSTSIDNIACAISSRNAATTSATRREGSPRSISKAITLGLVFIGLSVVVVFGVVLGRNDTSRDDVVATQAASGSSIAQQIFVSESQEEKYSPDATGDTPMIQTAIESESNALKSTASEYYTSTGPLQARVKMVSPSILDGYETCSDLERDITEALKLYMDEFIMNEAVVNEIYASCDPDNDDWYSDFFGGEYYYYDHQYYGALLFYISICYSVHIFNVANCTLLESVIQMTQNSPVLQPTTLLLVQQTVTRYRG